ncbi:MAG TPA: radical SAM protein, partial [Thermoanaerobaculia bacterium]|nr:radical SAM protein [Thermoanaerobaculia bacterium]
TIITRNHLVTRDADHLSELARFDAAQVMVSITTLDPKLANIMEPRTSTPAMRLAAVETLVKAGVPVGVMVAPVIPAITDSEMPKILAAARDAGATSAGFVVLRLPWAVAPLFEQWLDEHFPDRKEKVLNRIKDLRGGKLYDPRWGIRGRGEGIFADQIAAIFDVTTRKLGLNERRYELSVASFRRRGRQGSLF